MGTETNAFLMNCWYVAAWEYEVIDGRLLPRTIVEKPVVLYRGDSGRVVALDNRCCHRGARLSNGRREGDDIRCMYHGLKFDPSGKCIQIPGQDNIPPKLGVRGYPVVERDHRIWIWMGEAAKADPAKILDFPYSRDPAWRGKPDYMHYKANYLLIVDNLSDFAHLAFVHTKTLGGSEEYAYKSKPTAIERLEDGFRVERWHLDADAPPFHKKVVHNAGRVDRRNIARISAAPSASASTPSARRSNRRRHDANSGTEPEFHCGSRCVHFGERLHHALGPARAAKCHRERGGRRGRPAAWRAPAAAARERPGERLRMAPDRAAGAHGARRRPAGRAGN